MEWIDNLSTRYRLWDPQESKAVSSYLTQYAIHITIDQNKII